MNFPQFQITLFSTFLLLVSLFLSPAIKAADDEPIETTNNATQNWFIMPRITTGIMNYNFEVGSEGKTSIIKDRVNFSENLPFLGIGAALLYNHFFVDVNFQTTVTEAEINEKGFFTDQTSNIANDISYDRDTQLDRQDYSLSLGYQVTNNFSLFAGYQHGKTNYDWTENRFDENGIKAGTAVKENEFIAGGFFFGVSGSTQIKKGTLGLSLSFANLDGRINTHRIHVPGDDNSLVSLVERNRYEKISSDTLGVKWGINWHAPITDDQKLNYSVQIEGYRYQFESNRGTFRDTLFNRDHETYELLNLEPFDVKETVYSLKFSLIYRF